MEASYRALHRSGELRERAGTAGAILRDCTVCPRTCRVNRLENELGYCRTGRLPWVSSYGPHFGEEPPLVGSRGSGTIFFTHCNMRCEFCQNYEISQCDAGREVTIDDLAGMMLGLQERDCHNINLVTPSHVVPQILAALEIAAGQGLSVPLVYNSSGYDLVSTLRLLEGVVDIYMPDAKYGRDDIALALSDAPQYVEICRAALKEMHRQVGDLQTENGIATRGLIVRHLVLPHDLATSERVLRFIAEEISRDSYVNIMDQYRPMWHVTGPSVGDPLLALLGRPISREEYDRALRYARRVGLHRGFP